MAIQLGCANVEIRASKIVSANQDGADPVAAVRAGRERPYEGLDLRKDGTTFPVELCGKNIRQGGRTLRVTALRDGVLVGTRTMRDVSRGDLIRMMVGRELSAVFPKIFVEPGDLVITRGQGGIRIVSGLRDHRSTGVDSCRDRRQQVPRSARNLDSYTRPSRGPDL